jgi:hypothetical protein
MTDAMQQPYDNILKSLLEHQEAEMIAEFCPGATFLEGLDIEVLRTPLRVDRVYRALIGGKQHIIHLEMETSANPRMRSSLANYHTGESQFPT